MKRRHFLEATGLGAGALILPSGARFWNGSLTAIPSADKKALADAGLEAARRPAPPTPTSGSALPQPVGVHPGAAGPGIGNSESFGVGCG